MKRRYFSLGAVLAIILAGCGAPPAGQKTPSATRKDNSPAAWLREAGQSAGLGAPKSLQVYNDRNMYQAIDGEADLFLQYQGRSLTVAKFTQTDEVITIEIFDQVEPVNAFGVFHQLLSPEDTRIKLGIEGASAGEQDVIFWQSRYVLRVFGAGSQPPARENLLHLAQAVADHLPQDPPLPTWIKILPEQPRPEAVRYIRQNVLGLSYLSPAMVGEYRLGDKLFRLAVVRTKDELEARRQWEKLGKFYNFKPVAKGGGKAYTGRDPAEEAILGEQRGRYILLALGEGPETAREQLITAAGERLPETEK